MSKIKKIWETDIGLWYWNVYESPDLNMGIIRTILSSAGKMSEIRNRLNMGDYGLVIYEQDIIRTFAVISSHPEF